MYEIKYEEVYINGVLKLNFVTKAQMHDVPLEIREKKLEHPDHQSGRFNGQKPCRVTTQFIPRMV